MELTRIIKRPVITEKTNNQQQANNTYVFLVDWEANKFQIKSAIEFIFQVKVLNVNTLKMDKKPKRIGRYEGFTNRYKKAIVTLAEGNVINYYPQEAEDKEVAQAQKEAKKATRAKEKEDSKAKEAELAKKLAAKKEAKKASAKKANPEAKKSAPRVRKISSSK